MLVSVCVYTYICTYMTAAVSDHVTFSLHIWINDKDILLCVISLEGEHLDYCW